ncbi:30S ribosomal protein S6 [Chryseobacterium sp. 6424]|uniref:GYDIA family GHMP kinase n=1 Tax=Chryseobacterium sp. 6424 TaxID=2039166 RepID=UPI000EFC6F6E|nr:GYDIA family GHMP kinase [Chryseobacterium sp. 6424]AYO58546.1 30S ribosomal protein S6 [Chryseobacterium sp. 6424]
MTGKIFSPGKLLLTSEYTVLDGALALAVPTKWGQEFFFEEILGNDSLIIWEAYHQNQPWLKARINYQTWEIEETNLPEAALFIVKVLKNIQRLSDQKLQSVDICYKLRTNLQFPADYGLGSSSTLMNNLAEWAGIDAFLLNQESLGGSGYDIAVAKERSAVLYQTSGNERIVQRVRYAPSFKNQLVFVHLNQKQDSREGIKMYRSREKSNALIEWFSALTKEVILCEDLDAFSEMMTLHEQKLSNHLLIKTIREKFFQDCPVFVKSLGAWGGDFIMTRKFQDYEAYFKELGFSNIFGWDDIIN